MNLPTLAAILSTGWSRQDDAAVKEKVDLLQASKSLYNAYPLEIQDIDRSAIELGIEYLFASTENYNDVKGRILHNTQAVLGRAQSMGALREKLGKIAL